MQNINRYIDHTLLRPTATQQEISSLCKEAVINKFYAVCVNGCHIQLAKQELSGTDVRICSVISFPLGSMSREAKILEARQAVQDGADELDMVINIGNLKAKKLQEVQDEIAAVRNVLEEKILKVILETCFLTPEEISIASELAVKAQADFVKTSTGFGTAGATADNIQLIRNAIKGAAKIKASGGIRNFETALTFLELGVDRIGTSSGVSILKESYR